MKRVLSDKPLSTRQSRLIGLVAGLPGAALLIALLVAGFVYLAQEMLEGDLARLDDAILMAFRTAGNAADPIGPPWVEELGRDVTALGSFAFLGFLFAATVGYLLLIGARGLALLMTASVIGGVVVSTALKMGFDRARPDLPHAARVFTASFPSGHATLSAVTFLTLGALLTQITEDWRVRAYFIGLAIFLTIAVGISRLYLGVHYPSDVLAGWSVGTAWAVMCWTTAAWMQRRGQIETSSKH